MAIVPRSKLSPVQQVRNKKSTECYIPIQLHAFLGHRSWQLGVGAEVGETEVGAATEGRTGVYQLLSHMKNL